MPIRNSIIKNLLRQGARKKAATVALATTLTVAPASKALAVDLSKEAALSTHKVANALWAKNQASVVEKYLMGTGAQETWLGKYFDKFKPGGGKVLRQIVKGKPQGVARSVYQLEKPTVTDMVNLYARKYKTQLAETTGFSYTELKTMLSEGTLMKALEKPENIDLSTFLAAMKVKYTERVGYTIPAKFTVEDASRWWGKYYKTGATKAQLEQFKNNYKKFVPKEPSVTNTVGLTNKAMYDKRTQHQIMDTTQKTKHLFNIR